MPRMLLVTALALGLPACAVPLADRTGRTPEPTPPVRVASEPRVFRVPFDWNRASLTPAAQAVVAQAAGVARRGPPARIEIAGHADRSGPEDYNMALSRRRAEAVAAELVRLGIDRATIAIDAFGETRPLVPTPDGVRQARNRRVEIVLPAPRERRPEQLGWVFRCPPRGTETVAALDPGGWTARSRVYLGADPSEADVCLVARDGETSRLLFDIFPVGTELADAMRPVLRSIQPAYPGRTRSSVVFLRPQRGPQGQTALYRHAVTFRGFEDLVAPAGRFRVAVLEHHEEALNGSYRAQTDYAFSTASGALVGITHRHDRGHPNGLASWRALEVKE